MPLNNPFGYPSGGLLTPEEEKYVRNMGLLGAGAQMLMAAGPQPFPTSLGQVLGHGFMGLSQGQMGAAGQMFGQRAVRRADEKSKLEAEQMEMQRTKMAMEMLKAQQAMQKEQQLAGLLYEAQERGNSLKPVVEELPPGQELPSPPPYMGPAIGGMPMNEFLMRYSQIDPAGGLSALTSLNQPQDPTALQRDLQAAGLTPGSPEYREAVTRHYARPEAQPDVLQMMQAAGISPDSPQGQSLLKAYLTKPLVSMERGVTPEQSAKFQRIRYDDSGEAVGIENAPIGAPQSVLEQGYSMRDKPIPPEQFQQRKRSFDQAQEQLRLAVEKLYPEGINSGPSRRILGGLSIGAQGLPGTEGRTVNGLLRKFVFDALYATAGKQLSDTEIANVLSLYMPSVYDSDELVRHKLQRLENFALGEGASLFRKNYQPIIPQIDIRPDAMQAPSGAIGSGQWSIREKK